MVGVLAIIELLPQGRKLEASSRWLGMPTPRTASAGSDLI
jgi:hypothetical protein